MMRDNLFLWADWNANYKQIKTVNSFLAHHWSPTTLAWVLNTIPLQAQTAPNALGVAVKDIFMWFTGNDLMNSQVEREGECYRKMSMALFEA